ncbi:hypothetical protein SPRG_03018 [Saprolegnia parasitica CBS 223.65]|uniref:JmjC domain-containing protein n=1 Tax=Saprolegnia parasitica (strain CBS 223.65) TaxID=695850 RepID=A0A067CPU7_SAPPC|nr:hypothetical protein SPRG_03018 [Saprolegnia parasitica CBS 223.65]KDO32543.1 hypothetical protein SPRG_03018 [Saprolegnia parasitica CBS 223.65]|eukprot:XP_012196989.1 hypothetical protein SPRG_03018 [Saprolegnia parasitica CBS 223.65]
MVDALADVARWYRSQKLQGPSSPVSSDTRLHRILQLDATRAYLGAKIEALTRQERGRVSLEAALYIELLDAADPRLAHVVVDRADTEQSKIAMERFAFNLSMAAQLRTFKKTRAPIDATSVATVDAKDLSYDRFLADYALPKRPVILRGGAHLVLTKKMWSLASLGANAAVASKPMPTKRYVQDSVQWARLEDGPVMPLGAFIEGLATSDLYIHDHSVPLHLPELVEDVAIPAIFAHDYLQRLPEGALYRETWPSLFVGPKNTASQLHVDSFGSNFWMALLDGRKQWILVDPRDMHLLRPRRHPGLHDVVFDVALPLPTSAADDPFWYARREECILEAGDLLFVPTGTPHYVRNLTATLALSANYIDCSNAEEAIDALSRHASTDPRAGDVARHVAQCMRGPQPAVHTTQSVPFATFKTPLQATDDVLPATKRRRLDAEFLADWSSDDEAGSDAALPQR